VRKKVKCTLVRMGTERDRRQKQDSRTYSRTGKVAEDAATVLVIKETMSPPALKKPAKTLSLRISP